MARFKMVNGEKLQLTPQEETIRDAEENQWVLDRPIINWSTEMILSDSKTIPRYAEDILDGMPDKSGVAQILLDRLQAKKDLRATKP